MFWSASILPHIEGKQGTQDLLLVLSWSSINGAEKIK